MKITFVIGGSRSGKSSFALGEASGIIGPKAYIATAEALDGEMEDRIEKHKAERGSAWDTYEEPLKIAGLIPELTDKYNVVLLDCLTLWLSNVLIRGKNKEQSSKTIGKGISELVGILQKLKDTSHATRHTSRLFIVSNEVGMGIVPESSLARLFRDLAGALNQKVAGIADEVYLVTAGIPVKIKG